MDGAVRKGLVTAEFPIAMCEVSRSNPTASISALIATATAIYSLGPELLILNAVPTGALSLLPSAGR